MTIIRLTPEQTDWVKTELPHARLFDFVINPYNFETAYSKVEILEPVDLAVYYLRWGEEP